MSESSNARRGTRRQVAIERARQRRHDRIRAARERENAITEIAIAVAVNRATATDAELAAAEGIVKLRRMGETQQSIAELCEMTLAEVRTALALTRQVASAPETAAQES